MAESTAYSCPQCHATLKLDPSTGKLTCEFCGGSFDVEAIEAVVDNESSRKKAVKESEERHGRKWQLEQKRKGKNTVEPHADLIPEDLTSRSIDEWEALLAEGGQEQFDEVVGYTCTNCAAQVVTDKLTVATSCQYCGSSVVVDQRLTGGLKPGYVIPFKVDAKKLPDMLTEFYSKRPLLPKNFFYENQVGEVQGIYVPFWLYDGQIDGNVHYTSSESRSWTSGDTDYTEVKEYEHHRVGYVYYQHVPVDASERIDDDLMDSIEPYNFRDMKPFKAGYLTGFVAERFDQSPREVLSRAANRMTATTKSKFRDSVGNGSVKTEGSNYEFSRPTASYVLMPVYLFNCKYGGKHYRYAVNGQTGKIVGEVPSGKRESMMGFAKGFLKGLGFGVLGAAALALIAVLA